MLSVPLLILNQHQKHVCATIGAASSSASGYDKGAFYFAASHTNHIDYRQKQEA